MGFVAGTNPRFVTGRMSYAEGCDLAGFWLTFGKDTSLMAQVGTSVSFLSASSCAVEPFFSAQKARTRLLSEHV